MPNSIKYSTSAQTLALKKGNFWIGTGDVGKGPSDATGYYNGVTPPSGGYTIYLNREGAPGDLSYRVVENDEGLISFTNEISNGSFTTISECFSYFATQGDKVCFNLDMDPVITEGLILNFDSRFVSSYPTSGSSIYDLSDSKTGTLYNSPTFDGSNGSIVFDGVDDFMDLSFSYDIYNSNSPRAFSMEVWARHPPFTLQSGEIFAGAYGSGRFMGAVLGYGFSGGTTRIRFNSMYGGVGGQELTNYINQDDGWHQFVMTFEPPNLARNYVDGILRASRTLAPSSNAFFTDIRVAKNRGSECMKFVFGSLRSYSITLSRPQIVSNYLSSLKKYTGDNCVTDGLLLYLESSYNTSYNGSGTTWTDLSTNERNGTLINGPTFSSDNDGVIVFDGADDYVNGNFSYTFNTGWSVEIWVYVDSRVSYPDDEGIWRISSSGTRRINLRRRNVSSNQWRYEAQGPNASTGTDGAWFSAGTDGAWSQLICTYDGNSSLKAYHNGSLRVNSSFNIGPVPVTTYQIGLNSSPPYLSGRVSTFRVYSRELTSSEILQNYNAQKSRFGL